MEKSKMTIHRALAELKLIDSRIEKAINIVEPTGLMQLGKLVNGFYSKDEFEKEVKSKYQSQSTSLWHNMANGSPTGDALVNATDDYNDTRSKGSKALVAPTW